jgi:hypothetical protein
MRTPSIYGLALGLLCASLSPNAAASQSYQRVTVPFRYVDNRIMIDCMINGIGPFVMIVDTGSPYVAITPEAAKRLGVAVHDAGTVTGAGHNAVKNGGATLAALSIGQLSFKGVAAGVIDLTQIRVKLGFPHLDGIVGYPVLKQFEMFVNVDAGTISFAKTRPPIPSNATSTTFAGVIPVIAARIAGIATTVIVDTGDRSSLTLFTPFAKQHTVFARYPAKRNIVTGYGIGGPVYGDVFMLPSLDVLGTHFTGVVTRASRQIRGVFASSDYGGSIGTGILKRFNIVYDYPRHMIVAWPSEYFPTPDTFVPPGHTHPTARTIDRTLRQQRSVAGH